jgi:hypothetical protein
MLAQRVLRCIGVVCFLLSTLPCLKAQVSSPASTLCYVTDAKFTTCPNGQTEWSDVQPITFSKTNSFLYVNQDASHSFLYLMYDFPFRTTPIASTDSVHISFDTVLQDTGVPTSER